ncbi:MAG: hypothetical protein CJBNEKGG_03366 [Prosthecobacter sp.]|nr:hypothetical protein [Prosthecobacter sp.]
MPRKSSFLEPPETARKGSMSRLVSMFMLWLPLLLAAAPASAVMDVQPRNHAWEPPASGYDIAPDVRNGPNLYAYVKQNPWSKFDPLGLAEKKSKAGEVYFIVNHETKQAYVGETSGSAHDRMSHAQHPARSLLDTKGTQAHVRQVMANDGWEADVKANGFETSGKDPVASARNHITKSAERAEFYSRQKEFEGYTFLNDESKLIGEDKAMAARSRFGASRTARAQVRDVSVGSGFFGGRKLSFNRPRGGGAGTAASLLATAAYALSSPDAYADDIESQVYSWAGATAQARSGNLDFAGQADFTRQSHELGAAMTGGLPGANQAAVRQLLKAGGMHSGNASEDWSALGQIIKDNAN